MPNFAKLFQVTPSHQLLWTIRYHPDTKKDVVTQFTMVGAMDMAVDVEFKNEDHANKVFDDYGQEKANVFYAEMVKLLELGNKKPPDDLIIA